MANPPSKNSALIHAAGEPADDIALTAHPREETIREEAIREEAVAKLAHQLWIDRGCPHGSAEEDWYRAESLLRQDEKPSSRRPVRPKVMQAGPSVTQ